MKKLLVLGGMGMVGSSLIREASKMGYEEVLCPSRNELDLDKQSLTRAYFTEHQPDEVIVAAARVGGIHANSVYPAEFMYENLMIAANTVEAAYRAGVNRLLFLGSSCIYPRDASQPIQEESLLTLPLEATNEAYALAKIAGLKLCQYYRRQYGVCYHSLMPCNLYGPGDNYHPENSHVIPAMIRRFHEAKIESKEEVTIWGSGNPMREFLYVDDAARGCLHMLTQENPPDWVNLGSGREISIMDLAREIADVVGFCGVIKTDRNMPDGTPRKVMDNRKILSMDWNPLVELEQGLQLAYADFLDKVDHN